MMEEQANNSDSDSSDNWTVIDRNDFLLPDYGTLEYDINNSDTPRNQERIPTEDDTDTDGGIAVISDEESEVTTTTPDIPNARESHLIDGDRPSIRLRVSNGFDETPVMSSKDDEMEKNSTSTIRESEQELPDDFFLSDYKIKSYVHRKNDKMSSLLNGILLSTVLITIILALGYLWGTTDDCSLSTIKSVSQVLSNMQKLQLENDMLKSKIKHLQSVQNHRQSEDSTVFLDRESAFKPTEKRRSDYRQNNFKEARKMKPADYDSVPFDSNFGLKHPNIDRFNINLGLFSNFENQTSPETLEVHRTMLNSKISTNNKSKSGKYLKRFNKRGARPDCLRKLTTVDSSSFGPETYCESVMNHKQGKYEHKILPNLDQAKVKNFKEEEFKETKSHINSDSIRSEKKLKYEKKNKAFKKLDKKQFKVNKPKKDFPDRGNNSEKIKRQHSKINKVNSDWYQKMSNAREEFRKWHQYADEINHRKIKDKSNWYFRRMRDRESIRFNSEV